MRSVAGAQSGERERSDISNAVVRILPPELSEALGQQVVIDDRAGATRVAGTPAKFGVFLSAEIAKWGKIAREANIQPE